LSGWYPRGLLVHSSISVRFKSYLRGWLRRNCVVTGSDVTGSDLDRKLPEVTLVTDVCSAHAWKWQFFPRFFFTIVVVQNVPLRMTGSSMTTGCDRKWRHNIGSEGFPAFFGFFRIFLRFFVMLCCTPRVFSTTSAFSLWYFN
jgi:hypothetical protein